MLPSWVTWLLLAVAVALIWVERGGQIAMGFAASAFLFFAIVRALNTIGTKRYLYAVLVLVMSGLLAWLTYLNLIALVAVHALSVWAIMRFVRSK